MNFLRARKVSTGIDSQEGYVCTSVKRRIRLIALESISLHLAVRGGLLPEVRFRQHYYVERFYVQFIACLSKIKRVGIAASFDVEVDALDCVAIRRAVCGRHL